VAQSRLLQSGDKSFPEKIGTPRIWRFSLSSEREGGHASANLGVEFWRFVNRA